MKFLVCGAALLAACGPAAADKVAGTTPGSERAEAGATPTVPPIAAKARATTAPSSCASDAPQSPCAIAGRWRVTATYDPALIPAERTGDALGMTGSTFTLTDNADAGGLLAWDGPDTGQFDVSDRCEGPYLSPPGAQLDAERVARFDAALAAWKAPRPSAIRKLGCDSGGWATPSDASGEYFGLIAQVGDRLAFEWYEGRVILADRVA